MNRRDFVRLMAAAGLAGLAPGALMACDSGVERATVAEAKSNADRARPDAAAATDATGLARSNSRFAWALYRELSAGAENVFLSPYSVSLALAMVYAGARGSTAGEMAKALSFDLPGERLHAAFNALDQELEPTSDDAFRLSIANSAWGQSGKRFEPAYLDTLARNYGAGLQLTDFAGKPEPSRVAINGWVEERTEELIRDLLPEGSITNVTRLVLANAIYFKGDWETQFEQDLTSPGDFTRLDGSKTAAQMMRNTTRLRWADGDGFAAVELPYVGGKVAMLAIVPDAGRFEAVENAFDAVALEALDPRLAPVTVDLTMPEFEYSFGAGLKEPLSALGMREAFSDGADFSGMDGTRELFVSDVIHKAFVRVDEKGTEAAAATGAVIRATSAPANVKVVALDRPFFYLIRQIESGAVLFVGRVMDPAAK